MKKAYIVPQAKAILLNFEGMIADSLNSDGLDGTSGGGNTGDNGITGGDSNRRSIWGDEY